MKATNVMLFAIVAAALGRWAHNKQAVPSAKGLVEILFALVVVSFLDTGEAEPIARGFAWLFLAAVLLSNDSIITGLSNIKAPAPAPAAKPKVQVV